MAIDDFAPDDMATVARIQAKAARRAQARGLHADDAVLGTISQQLLDRLPLLVVEPTQLLDLGCRAGEQFDDLHDLYPDCVITGLRLGGPEDVVDKKPPKTSWMNRWSRFGQKKRRNIVFGDPHSLPFENQQFELVVSNLCLPLCQNPSAVFAEVSRVLRPGGAFLFSSLGPDTLIEYRQRWALFDSYPRVSGLIDMHDLGDAMLKAGLADPVLDRDTLTIDYPSVEALENEMQVFGLANTAFGRRKGLLTQQLVSQVRNTESRFSVGLELVHGHAWKDELRPERNSTGDEFVFPVSELQGSWKR